MMYSTYYDLYIPPPFMAISSLFSFLFFSFFLWFGGGRFAPEKNFVACCARVMGHHSAAPGWTAAEAMQLSNFPHDVGKGRAGQRCLPCIHANWLCRAENHRA